MTGKASDNREDEAKVSFNVFFPCGGIALLDTGEQSVLFFIFEYGEFGGVDTTDLDFIRYGQCMISDFTVSVEFF